MITSFMASAKQIAWRKKFAKLAKSGKFRKAKKSKSKIPKGAKVEPTVVYDFIHNKPYGHGRTKAQTEKIQRANNKIVDKLRKEGKW